MLERRARRLPWLQYVTAPVQVEWETVLLICGAVLVAVAAFGWVME